MDYLALLKYGAIGLCVILFIVSTRLLSKEQGRDEVRQPVLNSIRLYLGAAVLLSIFFGLTEFFSPEETNDTMEATINTVWERQFGSFTQDTTLALKMKRLKTGPISTPNLVNTEELETLQSELAQCSENLKEVDHAFYSNIVKLKKSISDYGDSINLSFRPEEKQQVFEIMEELLLKLNILETHDNSHSDIARKWIQLKRSWINTNHGLVLDSDVPHIVRTYLNIYHPA